MLVILIALASCKHNNMETPKNATEELAAFLGKEKFGVSEAEGYMGLGEPELLTVMNDKMNAAAKDFSALAAAGKATEEQYQTAVANGLRRFDELYINLDTEDRERVCFYFEQLMDIVGLKSSGGLLNDWMYNNE